MNSVKIITSVALGASVNQLFHQIEKTMSTGIMVVDKRKTAVESSPQCSITTDQRTEQVSAP